MDDRFLDLDRHGVLRPPLWLALCCAFLLRHWLLILFVAASARRAPETVGWAYGEFSWLMLVIESPALLLAIAWTRRVPAAGGLVRLLWRHGRELLTLAATLHLAWACWYLAGQSVWNPWPERFVALLALADAGIIVTAWRSLLLRELFKEFPVRPAPGAAEVPTASPKASPKGDKT